MKRMPKQGHGTHRGRAPIFSFPGPGRLLRAIASLCLAVAVLAALTACEAFPSRPPAITETARPTSAPAPSSTPDMIPTRTPTLVSPSPTPSPSPSATLVAPTPDVAEMLGVAEDGLGQIQAQLGEARLVCLRYEDLDADGAPEWLALAHQANASPPRLVAFVLESEATYPLTPAPPEAGMPDVGLGQYATCELVVRDVNVDGVVDIGIFGHGPESETRLHLFAWDGAEYRRLGYFSGDAGVHFADQDGDLEEEIWEGYRVSAAPSLVWYVIHTWEDGTYGWTSDRYDWYFRDRPQSYPTHRPEYAVVTFYLALNDRDLPGAYDLLLPEVRPAYETWAAGYATTVRVSVGNAHPIPAASGEERARIAAMVTAWDNEGGTIIGRLWNVEWETFRTEGGWRLGGSTTELLEEWSVAYWP